ncbi:MAG: UDP-N-acetylmuramate dehydrogenase [Proteobacteria bacterium]|nr:UDP-N-acetylmuramate dehydrogenase [Pseudomonadota bacterium]
MSTARIQLKAALEERLGAEVLENAALSAHTSFRIGGPAALLARATRIEELQAALETASRAGIPVLVLGGGTNLLVSDAGFDGLALRVEIGGVEVSEGGRRVTAGAGVATAAVVERSIAAGLAGLECAAGPPGTIGGAIGGNAGCFGAAIGDRLASATLVTREGEVIEVADPGWFAFAYRSSRLARAGAVIARAAFAVEPGDRARLEEISARNRGVRREKHPARGARTAGSYFKNLPPESPGGPRRAAGALLDQVGAKAMRVGDAAVFERHANIIVNEGTATARDVLALAGKMRAAVLDRFGEELEPEVRFVG